MRRWNGWGDAAIEYPIPANAPAYLAQRVGAATPTEDCSWDAAVAKVPVSRLPEHPHLQRDAATRLLHSFGQSLPDWLALRFGVFQHLTDGVWLARDDDDIRAALNFAAENNARVIIYGGGTSVVGHLTPPDDAVYLTLSLARLCKLKTLRRDDRLAQFDAGVTGPVLEAQLRAHGFTLGHFPQSFEFSTLGGWVATRSSGQQSHRYGRIEQLFAGGGVIGAENSLDIAPFPASAAGPDLREWLMGSEGRFGVISSAWVRITPLPETEKFRAIFFPDWISARNAARALAQSPITFSMLRVSNARETDTLLALAGHPERMAWLHRYLRWRGCAENKCMMLLGLSGSVKDIAEQWQQCQALLKPFGARNTGRYIGNKWLHNRYRNVYLRNSLWALGYAVDTVETACHWSQVDDIVHAIENAAYNALLDENERVFAYTHLSHVYSSGSSVYSTFVFRLAPDHATNLRRWQKLKTAVSNAIAHKGGTITHQHGVGKDHKTWFAKEKTAAGLAWINAVRREADPRGRFSGGNLLDD